MKLSREDVSRVWYDITRLEINIELENGTIVILDCYDEDNMYRKYDRIEWCFENKKAFWINGDDVSIKW